MPDDERIFRQAHLTMQPSSISALICVRIGTEAALLKANWLDLVMNCGSQPGVGCC